MVDEMDLLSGLKTAEPMRPHAFEEARATLRAAMVMQDEVAEPTTMPTRRARWGRGRIAGFSVAAVGAAAAAAVLVSGVASSTAIAARSSARAWPKACGRTGSAVFRPLSRSISSIISWPP